jgi:glycosyltransferase involved in cell wall biosynthesis
VRVESVEDWRGMKILLVSQMYPGADAPDHGIFVKQIADALAERGHTVERAVLESRAGGRRRYATLFGKARRAAKRVQPDVVYAHFLVPTGLLASLASRTPLVVTAHGRDVRNVGSIPGVGRATRLVARRAAALIAVSDYLRTELEARVPEARGKTEVVDCGVDLTVFKGADPRAARTELAWDGDGPSFLCVGTLDERKNVLRLARAFEHLGEGRLAFVGDGPLRDALEGRHGVRVVGRVAHEDVARWVAASDVVCQPSLVEPFGQALLEAMACERSVVATRVGGPPEFVTDGAGVLVDPEDEHAIEQGLRAAAQLPTPNPVARAAAAPHDVRRQAERIEAILERAARGRPA